MRRLFSKRVLGVVIALATTAPIVALSGGPAAADSTDVITFAGSDTTQDVMNELLSCDASNTCTVEGISNPIRNLKVPPNMGNNDVLVPADRACNAVTYNGSVPAMTTASSGPNAGKVGPPFGSGNGQTALANSVGRTFPNAAAYASPISPSIAGGCVDVARSSSYSSTIGASNPTEFEYFAFGLDAVGWGTASLNAPTSLTLQQLKSIYECEVDNWSEVGGKDGKIIRVLPQFDSGTRKFFVANVLGKSTSATFPNSNANGSVCDPVVETAGEVATPRPLEENRGSELTTAKLRNDYQSYIMPYSAGLWVYQANNSSNSTVDKRAGVRPGGLVNNDPTNGIPGAGPAWPMRWISDKWRLNDATIIEGTDITVTASEASTTLTAATPVFTGRAGQYLQGSLVKDGTVIQTVAADGLSATILPGAAASGTGTVKAGWSVISEGNPHVLNGTGTNGLKYPGVRYVYNILHQNSPSYLEARAIAGFNPLGAGLSPMCDGTFEGLINSNGFLALPKLDRNGGTGNNQLRSCVLRRPSSSTTIE